MSNQNIQTLIDEGKNIIQKTDGSIIEVSEARKRGCVISYVDCFTKQTELIALESGETFYYGDWDGANCIRKEYYCK